ncbi:nicotinate-nucleotide adenylyltransferase [Thiolapillus sp.]|uniref:nicotinate-nucleotide adenylyltransferase n=1 Tax=Thiolapillus sp. TaxID=2017437 RepID=UPI0025DF37DF|nr:nicotinate-nucleotide adenylyltransferase [Thiolapillus sp.]
MIGIFGGTFDPIHNGHLRTALDVYEALALDELRFIPLGRAVHRDQPQTPAATRLAMLQAAIGGQAGFTVDERELNLSRPSYSVHTLQSLRAELGNEVPLCLLMGRDAFLGFADWRQPEKILQLAHLVVMDRPGHGLPEAGALHDLMQGRVTREVSDLRGAPGGYILFQPVTRLDISSSDIRARLAQGRSVRWLVPETVRVILQAGSAAA